MTVAEAIAYQMDHQVIHLMPAFIMQTTLGVDVYVSVIYRYAAMHLVPTTRLTVTSNQVLFYPCITDVAIIMVLDMVLIS